MIAAIAVVLLASRRRAQRPAAREPRPGDVVLVPGEYVIPLNPKETR